MKPVLLLNPNGSQSATETMLKIARQHLPSVQGWTNPDGPAMITEPDALRASGEQIAYAKLPEASGVIIAAFGDPGAGALRERLACPVVGIGAAAAQAAALGGASFAVATTTPDLRAPIDALMLAEGSSRYLGAFISDGDPEALLLNQTALDAALIEAATRAIKAGADRVIIGGGPLAAAADRIASQISVPLIQPLPEACRAVIKALS